MSSGIQIAPRKQGTLCSRSNEVIYMSAANWMIIQLSQVEWLWLLTLRTMELFRCSLAREPPIDKSDLFPRVLVRPLGRIGRDSTHRKASKFCTEFGITSNIFQSFPARASNYEVQRVRNSWILILVLNPGRRPEMAGGQLYHAYPHNCALR